jgi:sugar fermentation stimulation protein A
MKGVYVLVISLPNDIDVQIGALGTQRFDAGDWVYVGSAFGDGSTSLEHRIRRHFSREKKIHWHIDMLLQVTGPPTQVIWSESEEKRECEIANKLRQDERFIVGPKGFGSSDCKAHCGTHLFKYNRKKTVETLQRLFSEFGFEYNSLKDMH